MAASPALCLAWLSKAKNSSLVLRASHCVQLALTLASVCSPKSSATKRCARRFVSAGASGVALGALAPNRHAMPASFAGLPKLHTPIWEAMCSLPLYLPHSSCATNCAKLVLW